MDYIYLFFSISNMNFTKKTNILYLPLLLIALSSCKKESTSDTKEVVEIKDADLPKNVLPKMKPMGKETPLTASYIAEKKHKIETFYKKLAE